MDDSKGHFNKWHLIKLHTENILKKKYFWRKLFSIRNNWSFLQGKNIYQWEKTNVNFYESLKSLSDWKRIYDRQAIFNEERANVGM